jgi:hypothetical protein
MSKYFSSNVTLGRSIDHFSPTLLCLYQNQNRDQLTRRKLLDFSDKKERFERVFDFVATLNGASMFFLLLLPMFQWTINLYEKSFGWVAMFWVLVFLAALTIRVFVWLAVALKQRLMDWRFPEKDDPICEFLLECKSLEQYLGSANDVVYMSAAELKVVARDILVDQCKLILKEEKTSRDQAEYSKAKLGLLYGMFARFCLVEKGYDSYFKQAKELIDAKKAKAEDDEDKQ